MTALTSAAATAVILMIMVNNKLGSGLALQLGQTYCSGFKMLLLLLGHHPALAARLEACSSKR